MNWQLGAITMLAGMAFPLSTGFLIYHIYLLWAGMTTNESAKWADLREDIADGLVYVASLASLHIQDHHPHDHRIQIDGFAWPVKSRRWVMLTENGEQPTRPAPKTPMNDWDGKDLDVLDDRWAKVKSIRELENIYDLGFWNNLYDILNRG